MTRPRWQQPRLGGSWVPRLLLSALFLTLPELASGSGSSVDGRGFEHRILVTQVPVEGARAAGTEGEDLPVGARIVLLDLSGPRESARVLTGEFVSAGRPSISVDAQRFLFVARKRAADPLSIWEMAIDDGRQRRVARCDGNCTKAIYASRLYTLDAGESTPLIVFSCAPSPAGDGLDQRRSSLFAAREDGSRPRKITFNPLGASDPLLLSDGRLVYASGTAAEGRGATLFTIFTDGTDVFPFVSPPASSVRQGMACESAGGEVVFVESDPADPLRGGALIAVPRTRSRTERRSVSASPIGRFHSPSPLPDGSFLVAFQPEGRGTYGIYRLDARDPVRLEPLFDAPDRHDLDPVAVVARPRQAGRSSGVDERVSHGELYCLDARLSGDSIVAGDPQRVAIASLSVFRARDETEPSEKAAGTGTAIRRGARPVREVLLGRVPVEADGSFHLRVPALTPLRVETLDSAGNVLHSMRSYLWVMPNERRGCIGCHEDRDLTPPNRLALALRRPPREIEIPAVEREDAAGKAP